MTDNKDFTPAEEEILGILRPIGEALAAFFQAHADLANARAAALGEDAAPARIWVGSDDEDE